jgi:hypothetical protein
MHKRIVAAQKKVADAEAALELIIKDVRAKCRHQNVVEAPFKEGTWVSDMLPCRLCTDCGYEEDAWHWPGMAEMTNGQKTWKKTVLNNELVARVSRDKLWSLRP